MVKVLEQYDFNKTPILGIVPESSPTPPASPVNGQLWFDSAAQKLKAYQAGAWVTLDLDTDTNTTYGQATTTVLGLVNLATQAEVNSGSDGNKVITPATLKTRLDAAIASLIGGAPGALDALNELAAALGNDPNFASTVTNALGQKYDSPGPGLVESNPTTVGIALATNSHLKIGADGLGLDPQFYGAYDVAAQIKSILLPVPAMATANTWTAVPQSAAQPMATPCAVDFTEATSGEAVMMGHRWRFSGGAYILDVRAAVPITSATYNVSFTGQLYNSSIA